MPSRVFHSLELLPYIFFVLNNFIYIFGALNFVVYA